MPVLDVELRQEADMPKPGQQAGEAEIESQASKVESKPISPTTPPRGQKVSLERGKATHKKNPGKRPKSGGS